jgi:hypothetical protein
MSIRKLPTALAAVTLAIAPPAAHAAPIERAAAPATDENGIGGTLLWLAIAIAVVVGAILIFDNDNDPVSP